ncbi:hypothetical protein JX265_012470 [Neoarthrinium moseri]|uniref:Uncharacterized protein n=1 Tax=Neoarthrinium moseri TaxID=1658444 RepID=A0A9P9WAY6_9PEZI|nr:hypothetical protein JX265_012470 [Neoarthrinium moseri]
MAPKRKRTESVQGIFSIDPNSDPGLRRTRPKGDHPQFEGNEGPTERLRKIHIFLRDNDVDRNAGWRSSFEAVKLYLKYADQLRREGHRDFNPYLVSILADCDHMVKVHERFESWNYGQSRWSTYPPPQVFKSKRLVPYEQQLPTPPNQAQKERRPSLYTSLVPRPHAVRHSPFMELHYTDPNPDWDAYFQHPGTLKILRWYTSLYNHSNMYWQARPQRRIQWEVVQPMLKDASNPQAINYAELENLTYEHYMKGQTRISKPPTPNISHSAAEFEDNAKTRGYRRAAIQKVLNLLTSSENRGINTPWRRVNFPHPWEKSKVTHFHPRALSREINTLSPCVKFDRCLQEEPSRWIFWYNQWLEQINYLSGWTRQSYNKRCWNDFKQIAWPINFRGPYNFDNKCIYDGYWLKMGKILVTLQKNLEKATVTNKRWMVERIVKDIKLGQEGKPLPDGVVARPGADHPHCRSTSYHLIDEVDVAWLEFLCLPPSTKALAGLSLAKPEDTLTILLDHRIQTLLNDKLHNPFWIEDHVDGNPRPQWRPREIAMKDLLPIINRVGREFRTHTWDSSGKTTTEFQVAAAYNTKLNDPPNALYQFSVKEARDHCKKLAKMGRIVYKCPEDPKKITEQWWSGEGQLYYYPSHNHKEEGGFVCSLNPGINPENNHEMYSETNLSRNPMRYPEERIRWRHQSAQDVSNYNRDLQYIYASEMVRRNRQMDVDIQPSMEFYMDDFLEEIVYKRGPKFGPTSVEARRKAPSWNDLLDYKTVIQRDLGYSWRTINFLRNLAFRMGRTIRHYEQLRVRTSTASGFTRGHLHAGLDTWKKYVDETWPNKDDDNDQTSVPFRASKPNEILRHIDGNHADLESTCMTTVFRSIRHGIIDDMVQNRTMIYPSRNTMYGDRSKFLGQYFERADIWSWGKEPVRRRHAPYRRERYFDMRRWPLNRQENDTRDKISSRADEDPKIQPVSALYKYDLKVGPITKEPKRWEEISRTIRRLNDPQKETRAHQLLNSVSKMIGASVGIASNGNTKEKHWEFRLVPPVDTPQSDQRTTLKPHAHDEPEGGRRPKEVFIPGPAVFPMGDTLLQQVKMSSELEKILDPKPTSILGQIVSFIKPPPERIPLLPEIDTNRMPRSSATKRKLPNSFVAPPRPLKVIKKEEDDHSEWSVKPSDGVKSEETFGGLKTEDVAGWLGGRNSLVIRTTGVDDDPITSSNIITAETKVRVHHNGTIEGVIRPDINHPGKPYFTGNNKPTFNVDARPTAFDLGPSVLPLGNIGPPTAVQGVQGPSSTPAPRPDPERRRQISAASDIDLTLPSLLSPDDKSGSLQGTQPSKPQAPQVIRFPPGVGAQPLPATSGLVIPGPDAVIDYPELPQSPRSDPSIEYPELPQPPSPSGSKKVFVPTSARQFPQSVLPTPESTPTHVVSTPQDQTPERQSWSARLEQWFDEMFPRGYRQIPTASNFAECAYYAIIESIKAQYPGRRVPTVNELRNSFNHPRNASIVASRKALAAMGDEAGALVSNVNNLTADQAGASLYDWGLQIGYNYQLCVVFGRNATRLLPIGIPSPPPGTQIDRLWIHNDETDEASARQIANEVQRRKANGGTLDMARIQADLGVQNHFSGLGPRGPPVTRP